MTDCDRAHCDNGDCPPCLYCEESGPPAVEALKRWHDEASGHSSPFRFCYSEPCKSVSEALEVR